MRLRGAAKSDFNRIEELLAKSDFKLEFKHLECLVVVEDDDGIVFAVASLQTILEAMFIVDDSYSRKQRCIALQAVLTQAEIETANLGYDAYHSFATNNSIKRILLKKDAKPVNGEVLIKWVNPTKTL